MENQQEKKVTSMSTDQPDMQQHASRSPLPLPLSLASPSPTPTLTTTTPLQETTSLDYSEKQPSAAAAAQITTTPSTTPTATTAVAPTTTTTTTTTTTAAAAPPAAADSSTLPLVSSSSLPPPSSSLPVAPTPSSSSLTPTPTTAETLAMDSTAAQQQLVLDPTAIGLTLLLVSGKKSTFIFHGKDTIDVVKETVYGNWPKDWADERPPGGVGALKILYLGKFLAGDSTLEANKIQPGQTTIVHMTVAAPPPDKGPSKSDSSAKCCLIL